MTALSQLAFTDHLLCVRICARTLQKLTHLPSQQLFKAGIVVTHILWKRKLRLCEVKQHVCNSQYMVKSWHSVSDFKPHVFNCDMRLNLLHLKSQYTIQDLQNQPTGKLKLFLDISSWVCMQKIVNQKTNEESLFESLLSSMKF